MTSSFSSPTPTPTPFPHPSPSPSPCQIEALQIVLSPTPLPPATPSPSPYPMEAMQIELSPTPFPHPPPPPSPSQMEVMQIEQTAMEDYILPEFTLAEIIKMEIAYKKNGEESLTQKTCQELATKFSCSVHRNGKPAIHWKQVQDWFEDKKTRVAAKVTSSPTVIGKSLFASDATKPRHSAKRSSAIPRNDFGFFSYTPRGFSEIDIFQKPKAQRVSELSELVFEALSSKDYAWYDVAAFLNFRNLCSGELEARVRFAGFGHDEDEWVNVRRGIRERSIPLEPSECHKVNVGDLVLAYRANEDHALYSDANVVEIQRRTHDDSACSCTFVVCFQYDNKEGHLELSEICCRPA